MLLWQMLICATLLELPTVEVVTLQGTRQAGQLASLSASRIGINGSVLFAFNSAEL